MLWMKKMLINYGIQQEVLRVFCDDQSAVNISKNNVQHSHMKHIGIRHHFIREIVEQNINVMNYVITSKQLAFTKPLNSKRFEELQRELPICIL